MTNQQFVLFIAVGTGRILVDGTTIFIAVET
jgi:hypothetical protein